MNFKVMVRKNVELSRCPSCNSIATLKKSRSRNLFERFIIKLFFFRAFICRNCGWRGNFFRFKLARNGLKVLFIYVAAVIVSAFIVRYFLNRTFS
jgi:uncharacterized protein with PIN domain